MSQPISEPKGGATSDEQVGRGRTSCLAWGDVVATSPPPAAPGVSQGESSSYYDSARAVFNYGGIASKAANTTAANSSGGSVITERSEKMGMGVGTGAPFTG